HATRRQAEPAVRARAPDAEGRRQRRGARGRGVARDLREPLRYVSERRAAPRPTAARPRTRCVVSSGNPPSPERLQVRLILEKDCRRLAALVARELPPHQQGFALFLFDFGPKGNIAYASNARREDMIVAIREWLEHAEKHKEGST